jgi:hypothetical protein
VLLLCQLSFLFVRAHEDTEHDEVDGRKAYFLPRLFFGLFDLRFDEGWVRL